MAANRDVKTFQEVVDSVDVPKNTEEKRDAPKELQVAREEEGLYYIRYTAGGEVPDTLKGRYTHMRVAQAAIADHLKVA